MSLRRWSISRTASQMECLVEVASEEEVERALKVQSDIIGINNRDLKTFEVDLAVTERLRPLIPMGPLRGRARGIHTRARFRAHGEGRRPRHPRRRGAHHRARHAHEDARAADLGFRR